MCKKLKAILFSIYCAIFLHSLVFLLFHIQEEIIEINYLVPRPGTLKKIMREIKKNRKNKTLFTMDFVKPIRLPGDLKFILKWNDDLPFSSSVFADGQKSFLSNNCTYNNCYFSSDKSLLVDIINFDSILFDVEFDWDEHPPLRTPSQFYIFAASETANSYPICDRNFDNYYNLTWTYRLDSNITKLSFVILDKHENTVGPRIKMNWVYRMLPTTETVKRIIKGKSKAALWLPRDCDLAKSTSIITYIQELNVSLAQANLSVDTYGWCGKVSCPRNRIEECLMLLRKDYFFYFAFEPAFSEDYVSEDILYPLLNYAVPIVYGEADYTRFLPPGSYIDARKLSPKKVVSLMVKAIENPEVYYDYFRWHNHYTYREASKNHGICDLCKILNDETNNNYAMTKFRKWWNPHYEQQCQSI